MSEDDFKEEPKHSSTLDKVIMGAIIGTAIGSALGASVAPKPGKETRAQIKAHTAGVSEEIKEVSTLARETTWGFFRLIKRLLFGKAKSQHTMREIPHEPEHLPTHTPDSE